jgi:hypothetical protein
LQRLLTSFPTIAFKEISTPPCCFDPVDALLYNQGAVTTNKHTFSITQYVATLNNGRLILWCYLIWYCVVLARYFDPSPRLWLTSLGLSVIIGFALFISTTAGGGEKVKLGFWQTFRLFLMPFCVSSFSALVKGRGFFLIFSPHPGEIFLALTLCALLCVTALLSRRFSAAGITSAANAQRRRQTGHKI